MKQLKNFRPVQKNTAKSKVKLNVLYEDENVIFLNKPVGMLSQKANREDTSLVEYLIEYLLDSGQVTREELKTFHPAVCNRRCGRKDTERASDIK